MKIQLLLLCSTVIAQAPCEDECGLDKAVSTIKLALGVVKLVKDEGKNKPGTVVPLSDDDTSVRRLRRSNPSVKSYKNKASTKGVSTDNSLAVRNVNAKGVSTDHSRTVRNVKPIAEGCNQTSNILPASCADILVAGDYESGIYTIYPRWQKMPTGAVKVYCDQDTEDGGWTVIQRREDYEPRQSFKQDFENYAKGFGNPEHEFWIGNEIIHRLTTQENMIMRIDLEDWEGDTRYAHYQNFMVDNKYENFELYYEKIFDSNAGGDCFELGQEGKIRPFVAKNNDDTSNKLTDVFGKGGLWTADIPANDVYTSLNGIYYPKGQHLDKKDGIFWYTFSVYNSLKKVEMKLRPEYFIPPLRNDL